MPRVKIIVKLFCGKICGGYCGIKRGWSDALTVTPEDSREIPQAGTRRTAIRPLKRQSRHDRTPSSPVFYPGPGGGGCGGQFPNFRGLMKACLQIPTSAARSASSCGRCNIRHAGSNARRPPALAPCECRHGRLRRWERPRHCKRHGRIPPSTKEPGRPGTAI